MSELWKATVHRVHALGRGRYLLRTVPGGAAVSAAHGRRCVPAAGFHAHPVLAGLLGFIPGVGAMYNGQFVKALAHVLIFAVFVSLSDRSSFFGLLVVAWMFYQVFDAAQTAKARRDGLPLPNPFGLNDLGARLGMTPRPRPTQAVFATAARQRGDPSTGQPQSESRRGQFRRLRPPGAPTTARYAYPHRDLSCVRSIGSAFQIQLSRIRLSGARYSRISQSRIQGRSTEPQGHRHPVGAIVLIVIGLLLLLHTLGVFEEEWIGRAWPLIIIGVGAWLLYRRTHDLPRGGA